MDILLGKTPNITLLGSGCTKTVCSKTWLNYYLESLSSEELNNIKCERIETIFKFGNGKVCHSTEQITIQVVVVVQNVLVTTEIIKNDIPLLLSKDRMKKANTYIDFANDTIVIWNKEVRVKFTTSGHYCIPIGKKVDGNHDEVLKSGLILFFDDVNELYNNEKQKKLRPNCTVSLVILLETNLLPYWKLPISMICNCLIWSKT